MIKFYLSLLPAMIGITGILIVLADIYYWVITGNALIPADRIVLLGFVSFIMGLISVAIFAIDDGFSF